MAKLWYKWYKRLWVKSLVPFYSAQNSWWMFIPLNMLEKQNTGFEPSPSPWFPFCPIQLQTTFPWISISKNHDSNPFKSIKTHKNQISALWFWLIPNLQMTTISSTAFHLRSRQGCPGRFHLNAAKKCWVKSLYPWWTPSHSWDLWMFIPLMVY